MAKRYFVNATIEIYVPEQGWGPKSTKNEDLDAEWFANEICSQIPKLVNEKWKYSERDYSVNWVHKEKVEK